MPHRPESPNANDWPESSELEDAVLSLLEDADIPEEVIRKIEKLIHDAEVAQEVAQQNRREYYGRKDRGDLGRS